LVSSLSNAAVSCELIVLELLELLCLLPVAPACAVVESPDVAANAVPALANNANPISFASFMMSPIS